MVKQNTDKNYERSDNLRKDTRGMRGKTLRADKNHESRNRRDEKGS